MNCNFAFVKQCTPADIQFAGLRDYECIIYIFSATIFNAEPVQFRAKLFGRERMLCSHREVVHARCKHFLGKSKPVFSDVFTSHKFRHSVKNMQFFRRFGRKFGQTAGIFAACNAAQNAVDIAGQTTFADASNKFHALTANDMIRGVHKKHFGNAHLKHDPHASVNASLCVMSNQVIGVAAMFDSAVNKCRYPRSMVMLRVFQCFLQRKV